MTQEVSPSSYRFKHIPNKEWSFMKDKQITEAFMKWSVLGRIGVQAFCFDRHMNIYEKDDFVKEFLTDPAVLAALQVLNEQGRWTCLAAPAGHLDVELVPCTETTLSMFDKLVESGVVRENGRIRKCMEEYVGDLTLADELRKLLAGEESDYDAVFSEVERAEFLYRLLAHLALGGRWCQYEDELQPYLDATRHVYKDLVSVCKSAEAGGLRVISHVLKVTARSEQGVDLIPRQPENLQNFLYLIVDPLKRCVTTFYHQFGAMLPVVQ